MFPQVMYVIKLPESNKPCTLASQIILKATRSLRLPPGLNISSLESIVVCLVMGISDAMCFNSNKGVWPMSSVTSFAQCVMARPPNLWLDIIHCFSSARPMPLSKLFYRGGNKYTLRQLVDFLPDLDRKSVV